MNYLVKTKINEKWFTLGRVEINKFGKPQLSLRNTPELKELVNNGKDWLNLSLFEKTDDNAPKAPRPAAQPVDDDLPPF